MGKAPTTCLDCWKNIKADMAIMPAKRMVVVQEAIFLAFKGGSQESVFSIQYSVVSGTEGTVSSPTEAERASGEMADTRDLGSRGASRAGSSPVSPTIFQPTGRGRCLASFASRFLKPRPWFLESGSSD